MTAASPRPALTVVVPTRDRPGLLAACLSALRTAVGPADEVLVVDSASQEPEAVRAVVEAAGASYLRADLPGTSRARNAGWVAARHGLVVFTDDDCLPQPGWADAYAAALASDDAGFAWGPVTVPAGRAGVAEVEADGPTRARPGDDVTHLGASCNLAVRRQLLQATGGFDERLGPGTPLRAAEDRDLLARLLLTGAKGVLVPGAVVVHDPWRSRAELVRLHHSYGLGSGALAGKLRTMGVPVDPSFTGGLVRTQLRTVVTAARGGHRAGVVYGLARASGVVRGRRAVRSLGVVDGHLRG